MIQGFVVRHACMSTGGGRACTDGHGSRTVTAAWHSCTEGMQGRFSAWMPTVGQGSQMDVHGPKLSEGCVRCALHETTAAITCTCTCTRSPLSACTQCHTYAWCSVQRSSQCMRRRLLTVDAAVTHTTAIRRDRVEVELLLIALRAIIIVVYVHRRHQRHDRDSDTSHTIGAPCDRSTDRGSVCKS